MMYYSDQNKFRIKYINVCTYICIQNAFSTSNLDKHKISLFKRFY